MSEFIIVTLATVACIGLQWFCFAYAQRQDADHWLNRPLFSRKPPAARPRGDN
jgi:hypothetical protein